MKWILMLWMQSTDSGFPGWNPAVWKEPFDTQEACIEAGEKALKESPLKTHTVEAYTCQTGNVKLP